MDLHESLAHGNHRESFMEFSAHEEEGEDTVQIPIFNWIEEGATSRVKEALATHLAEMVVCHTNLGIIVGEQAAECVDEITVDCLDGFSVEF
jgi:hypothetical protein